MILDKEIPSVCNFVNGNFEKSLYYEDDIVVFYMLSKAYKRGTKCIRPALKNLYEKLKKSVLNSETEKVSKKEKFKKRKKSQEKR